MIGKKTATFLGIFWANFAQNWWTFLTKKDVNFSIFVRKWGVLAYATTTATKTLTTFKFHLLKTGSFAGNFEQLVWTIVCVCTVHVYVWPSTSFFFNRDHHYFALLTTMCPRNAPMAKLLICVHFDVQCTYTYTSL